MFEGFKRRLIAQVDESPDVSIIVSTLNVEGEEFLDIRQYFPSNQRDGRGITVPKRLTKALAQALLDAEGA